MGQDFVKVLIFSMAVSLKETDSLVRQNHNKCESDGVQDAPHRRGPGLPQLLHNVDYENNKMGACVTEQQREEISLATLMATYSPEY